MGKKERRKVVLSDYRARMEDDAGIDIEAADGKVFSIPPPTLWPDEVAIAGGEGASGQVKAAKALIGEDNYADFVKAGGSSAVLWGIIQEELQADSGKSSRSSNS